MPTTSKATAALAKSKLQPADRAKIRKLNHREEAQPRSPRGMSTRSLSQRLSAPSGWLLSLGRKRRSVSHATTLEGARAELRRRRKVSRQNRRRARLLQRQRRR